jgi:hypothetical protein
MYVAWLFPVWVEMWVTEAAWVIPWHGHGRRYATENGWESGVVRSESEHAGRQWCCRKPAAYVAALLAAPALRWACLPPCMHAKLAAAVTAYSSRGLPSGVCPLWRRAIVSLCGALCQMAFERQHYMTSVTVRITHDRSVRLGRKEVMQCHPVCFRVCVPVCVWHHFGVPPGCFFASCLAVTGRGIAHACMTAAGARCKCVLALRIHVCVYV